MNHESLPGTPDPVVSFIIPAWNEEAVLGQTLQCIRTAANSVSQAYEMIVADDGSTDRTVELACQQGARVVHVQHRRISATRNSGAQSAKGKWLFFVDADTLVNATVIQAAINALQGGATGGGSLVRFDDPVPKWVRLLEKPGDTFLRILRLAYGCFLFCTREAFETAGGFDSELYAGEEIYLSLALRRQGRFVIVPHAVITSGRKLRVYSAREILVLVTRMLLGGRRFLRQQVHKEMWYVKRVGRSELDELEH